MKLPAIFILNKFMYIFTQFLKGANLKPYKVIIASCPDYNPDTIAELLLNALPQLKLTKPITGNIAIKPNLVMAHPKVATESFTNSAVIEGILRTILSVGKEIKKISIVEKSGLGITTATAFRHAGYRRIARKYQVRLVAMEESRQVRIGLDNGQLHKSIRIARELANRDFLIFAPKLKTNVLSQAYSGALKLNIGSIDSKERMYHHNIDLPRKIADLLEVINPDLIVTDGIRFSYGGNQMTQSGMNLGVLVISINAVAHDMVCAKMLNLDPEKIDHIREAVERGYGPRTFDDIEIVGKEILENVQTRVKNLILAFIR